MNTRGAPGGDWRFDVLRSVLESLLPGIDVELRQRCRSTNSELMDRLRQADGGGVPGAASRREADMRPCLLVAVEQTAGRGRLGRVWRSVPGDSLTFTLALPLAASDWSGLSLAVGAALADAIEPLRAGVAPRLGLKWPNDLWLLDPMPGADAAAVAGRKLGGILIETVQRGDARWAVIGVGLNVAAPQGLTSDDAAYGVAGVREIDPAATAPALLARVAPALVQAVQCFEREGFAGFRIAYASRDVLAGRPVRTTQEGMPEGVARGIAPDGGLLVETGRGLATVRSGDVSVRLRAPEAGDA